MKPRVLVLAASGTNRDRDALVACELAGGAPEVVHINQLRSGERHLSHYQMLLIPGGFSYGDDLGAGRILATDLLYSLGGKAMDGQGRPPLRLAGGLEDNLHVFARSGRPILGICNGFQALVKAGFLPGPNESGEAISSGDQRQMATLTTNASNRFECRWVYLRPNPDSPCIFTRGLSDLIYCPVAHGEGRFVPKDEAVLQAVQARNQVAMIYTDERGEPAEYPYNPNGSIAGIAGVCNSAGNILGLMPHPEDHVVPEQHPRRTRGEWGHSGLSLFENGIRYASQF